MKNDELEKILKRYEEKMNGMLKEMIEQREKVCGQDAEDAFRYAFSLQISQELLERNKAKKVIRLKVTTPGEEHYRYMCPECDYFFGYETLDGFETNLLKDRFCHHCGQRLDWRKE